MVVALLGPTGSGKTALAIRLARRWDAPVISCDSRSIYQGLRALTAAPNGDWDSAATEPVYRTKSGIPYHFVDFMNPREKWDASLFAEAARGLFSKTFRSRSIAILAGGSGFYWRALRNGLDPSPPVDPAVRRTLNKELAAHGLSSLLDELRRLDPAICSSIDQKNPRRVLRAVELCRLLKHPVSLRPKAMESRQDPWDYRAFYPDWPRSILKIRIKNRVRDNWARMTQEVQRLMREHGPRWRELPGCQALLAGAVGDFLEGRIDENSAVEECLRLDAAYAKRQRTWFKKDPGLIRITAPENGDEETFFNKAEKTIVDYVEAVYSAG